MKALLVSNAPQGSAEWYAARKNGIGASDAAALFNLSQYTTPLELWREKRDPFAESNDNFLLDRGKAMEPVLRKYYSKRIGKEVTPVDGIYAHPDLPQMMASLDGVVADEGKLVEFKTASSKSNWGDAGSDQIPDSYMIQVQQALAVTGFDRADIGVSFFGMEPTYFHVTADAEMQQMIMEGIRDFWRLVVEGVEPAPSTVAEYQQRFAIATGKPVYATPELEEEFNKLLIVRAQLAQLEEEKERIDNEVKKFLSERGGDTLLNAAHAKLCTWTETKGREGLDTKLLKQMMPDIYEQFKTIGNPYRTLRIK